MRRRRAVRCWRLFRRVSALLLELFLRRVLHVIQQPDVGQRLGADRGGARAGFVELAAGMRQASDLRHMSADLAGVDAVVAAEGVGL